MNWRRFIKGFFFTRLIIIACVIKMGCSLKCYVCDTELNSTCAKINKESKLKAQECNIDHLNNPPITTLGQLSYIIFDARFLNMGSLEGTYENYTDFLKFECVKIISSDAGGRQMVHRSCQLKQPNYCNIVTNKAWEKSQTSGEPIEIVNCQVCDDKDNCNGASSNQFPFILMAGLLTIISVFS